MMVEQGSEAWHQQRLGKVTASRVKDVLAKGRSGQPSASRANYLAELLIERITNRHQEGFRSADMDRGNELEDDARSAYAFYTDTTPTPAEFVDHRTISMFGASPDRLVGDDGLIEIKCPNAANHLETLLASKVKSEYITQMQSQLACTGRKWVDFCSFNPDFPEDMRLKIIRFERDEARIAEIEMGVSKFLRDLDAKQAAVAVQFPGAAAA